VVDKALAAPADVHPQVLTLRTPRPRSTVSVRMAAFLLVARVAMTCAAFGLVDTTRFTSAQHVFLHQHHGRPRRGFPHITVDLGVVSRHHPGICFEDPLCGMADGQMPPSGTDLLHPEAVHVKMLPPSELGLSGFRHSDWHQNATEGMPCTPKSLPSWSVRLVTSARLAADKSAAAQRV
jgi:hypothetical protein